MQEQPRLYNYHDYRLYLKDIFDYMKSQKISMRKLAKEFGVSNAYLTMVLNRKRNLDPKYVEQIADYLRLNKSERSYLKNLIILSDSEKNEVRSEAYKQLSRFASYKNEKRSDVVTHKYLKHWYYVAIREMSFLKDFVDDPYWIQERLKSKVGIKEIKKALDFLKKNNLLEAEDNLDCSDGVYKLALTEFHKEMLSIVADSIENVERDKRMILGHTKSLSQNGFHKAREIMIKAIEEIAAIDDDLDKGDLYHFYFTGIPLTLKDEGEE